MEPLVSIALVFAVALLWLIVPVLLLSRINRDERQAMRQQRKALRMKERQSHKNHVPKRAVLARKRGFKLARRHSESKPPARPSSS
ncbi:hypothetical protein QFZ23_004228 [Arthrobacter globiformis]|jgi:hypothetical protein|uniref:hypothetical protein n=1 Tax=Arthrobacter globiformis TaxID=1665 RepID=UPI0027845837|nr:hypothetical protein [Arthrobacter globiformis]MDQ1060327.1 hypothetical protein [Arthrobacter globiformis]